MKLTQKDIVLKCLQKNEGKWFEGFRFTKVETPFGWLGSEGDRRARELAEEGMIERKHEKGYSWYRAVSKSVLVTKAEDGRVLATEKVW